jgi:hypothetical protein
MTWAEPALITQRARIPALVVQNPQSPSKTRIGRQACVLT